MNIDIQYIKTSIRFKKKGFDPQWQQHYKFFI